MQLTNRSKQVSNKQMTLAERAYLPAIATGLGITIKHFFQKKVTIKYPEVQRNLGPVFRGHHVLKRDENGAERCTACGLCAVACPAEAISMVASERTKGEEKLYREEKYAAVYEINMLRCIFCGLCEEACPKQAIYLRHDKLVPVFTGREGVIFGKDKLVEKLEDRYLRTAWTKEEADNQDKNNLTPQPRVQL
jgi:NADH-quinone oxidoreductase subunit I